MIGLGLLHHQFKIKEADKRASVESEWLPDQSKALNKKTKVSTNIEAHQICNL